MLPPLGRTRIGETQYETYVWKRRGIKLGWTRLGGPIVGANSSIRSSVCVECGFIPEFWLRDAHGAVVSFPSVPVKCKHSLPSYALIGAVCLREGQKYLAIEREVCRKCSAETSFDSTYRRCAACGATQNTKSSHYYVMAGPFHVMNTPVELIDAARVLAKRKR